MVQHLCVTKSLKVKVSSDRQCLGQVSVRPVDSILLVQRNFGPQHPTSHEAIALLGLFMVSL